MTSQTYFDGQTFSYAYTPTGQRLRATDSLGVTTYGYDNRDRLISIATPSGQQLTYAYDAADQRTGMTTPAGTTSFSYDAGGRLTGGGGVTFTYDPGGNRAGVTMPNGIAGSYSYDTLNRLTAASYHHAATTVAQYTYALDAAGNRTALTEAEGSSVVWTYDAAARLVGERRNPAGGSSISTSYTYDGVGNRIAQTAAGQTAYNYNALDQLTTAASGASTTSYNYDGRGNLTGVSAPTGTTTYRWEGADRLAGATLTDGTSVANVYDADGRRVRQTVGASTTNGLWDEASQYGDVVLETDGSGAAQASYVLAQGDRLSQTRASGTSFYLHDGQGSVRGLTDASGAASDTYSYDAFGRGLAHTGTTPNTYGYDGEQTDANSSLLYLRARYDDPSVGRFLSRDRAALNPSQPAGLNRYIFARNNPATMHDPSGNSAVMEYPLITWNISIRQIAAVAAIGAAVSCIFVKVASVLAALNHDSAELMMLKHTFPAMCVIPIQKTDPFLLPNIAAHILAAQNAGAPMLLIHLGPGNPMRD